MQTGAVNIASAAHSLSAAGQSYFLFQPTYEFGSFAGSYAGLDGDRAFTNGQSYEIESLRLMLPNKKKGSVPLPVPLSGS